MGAGYTDTSSYNDGDTIDADDSKVEFAQLDLAFDAAGGHTHDGTAGEGGQIDSGSIVYDNTGSALAATDVDAALDELDADVATAEGRLTTAESNITSNDGDITALDGRLTTAESNITSNDGDITALDGRLTTAESNITSNDGDITSLQNDKYDSSDLTSQVTAETGTNNTELMTPLRTAESIDANAEGADFTPTGAIAATTIAGALAELDTEKLALSGGTMSGDIDTNGNDITLGAGDVDLEGGRLLGGGGSIDMENGDINNVNSGTAADDVATIEQVITTTNVAGSPLRIVAMGRWSGGGTSVSQWNCTMSRTDVGVCTVVIGTNGTSASKMIVQTSSEIVYVTTFATSIATTGFEIGQHSTNTIDYYDGAGSFVVYEII